MRRINGSLIGPRTTSIAAVSYSVKFDGSTSYLSTTGNDTLSLTGDFTIEMWINGSSTRGSYPILLCRNDAYASSNNVYICYRHSGSPNTISLFRYPGGRFFSSTLNISDNNWYHVALVRSGSGTNNCVMYINGSSAGSYTDTSTYYFTYIFIGSNPNDGGSSVATVAFGGYISNLRIVKGIAVYTGGFSVPSSLLSAIQSPGTNIAEIPGIQTSLLVCNDTTLIDKSVNNFTIYNEGASLVGAFGVWGLDEYYVNLRNNAFSAITAVNITYLIIAGGGGGGGGSGDANFTYSGGGGGAGGFLQGTITFQKASTYSITVGTGGAGGAGGASFSHGIKGNDSSIIGTGINIITYGGGYGGKGAGDNPSGGDGGSGGGGGGRGTYPDGGIPGSGISGQGYGGGYGGGSTSNSGGGGGGGAGGAGTNGNTLWSGNTGSPGAGVTSAITGTSITYGSGGAVASGTASGPGSGGGSGGGGVYLGGGAGSAGRNGIVIFSYPTAYGLATATGTYTQATIGTTDALGMGAYNYVYSFTGNGTIIF